MRGGEISAVASGAEDPDCMAVADPIALGDSRTGVDPEAGSSAAEVADEDKGEATEDPSARAGSDPMPEPGPVGALAAACGAA